MRFDSFIRPDKGCRVLIEADADGKRIVGECGYEASQTVALTKVLVDDESIGESQTRRESDAARYHCGAFIAKGDHMLAQDARPCAGPADGDAVSIAHANEFCDRRAAEQRRQAQLIPARKEDSAGLLEAPETPGLLTVAAGIKVHHGDFRRSDLLEDLLIAGAGLVHAACRRDDDDVCIRAAGNAHEALEDLAVIFLILCAADRNDPPTCLAVGNFTGHYLQHLPRALYQ